MMQLISEKLADGVGSDLPPCGVVAGVVVVGYDVGMAISTKVSENDGHAPQGLLYMPAGEHVISATFNGQAATRRVVVTAEAAERLQADLAAVWQEVEAGKRARPCVYFNHESGPAAMVPRRFSWVPGKGVVLEGEWTAAGRAAVEGGDFAYFSPCFRRDRESGEVMGLTQGVEVGSLVNDPAFEENECIAAARNVPRVEDVMAANFSGCNQYGHGFAGDCESGGNGGQSTFGFFSSTKDAKRDRLKRNAEKAAKAYFEKKKEIDGKYDRHEKVDRDEEVEEQRLRFAARQARKKARDGGLEFDDDDLDVVSDWDKEDDEREAARVSSKGKRERVKAGRDLPPREEVALAGHCGDNEGTAGGGGNTIMDEAKLKMLLGLPADADSAAIEAALTKCAGAGKKLEKVEAELADLKKKEHEHKEKAAKAFSDGLLKKGVIAPKDEDKIQAARNLYMQSPVEAELVFGSLSAPKEEAAVAGRVMPDASNAANVSVEAMLAAEFNANK